MVELTPDRLAGQLLVAGFPDPQLPTEMAAALARGLLGGVIVFRRNLPSLGALRALLVDVVDQASEHFPPFIGIDEEGGRVSRLPLPLPRLPPLRTLGARCNPVEMHQLGAALGTLLRTLGFNLDFAPVLDVDTNPENPVIGDRSLARDPDTVARLGVALADGLLSAGVLPCGKHFPGHGDTVLDSHLALPRVSHAESRLRAVELVPFVTAIRAEIAALMTAHVIYDAFAPRVPATLSEGIVTRLLRHELGFSGVLFSDDLEMRALSDHMPVEESAIAAVRAGCDVLLICHSADLQARARHALADECRRDALFRARCKEAVERSLRARQRCSPRIGSDEDVERAGRRLSDLVARLMA